MFYEKELTQQVIGAAMSVHRELGPGLLESAYQACLAHELGWRQLPFEVEVPLPVKYRGLLVECGYRLDIVVAGKVILELKAVEQLHPVHQAQLMTYLKLSGHRVGLLINFNVNALKDGIVRRVL